LPILTLEDTSEYINARLRGAGATEAHIFSPETVQTLYSFARGIPRITNLLCERAMIDAYAEQLTVVSPGHVRKVAAEYGLDGEVAPISLIDVALPPRERVPSAIAKAVPTPVRPVVENHVAPGKTPEANPAVPAPVSTAAPASAPVPAVWFAPAPARAPQLAKPTEKQGKEFIVEFCLDSAQQQESPKIVDGFDWRKFRPENPFKGYWAEVWRTFRKDARALYSSVARSMKSFARNARGPHADVRGFYRSTAPKVASFARNLHRKSFGTLSNWLRRPISKARPRVSGPARPQVRTGKS
jgi:hypothetical protein